MLKILLFVLLFSSQAFADDATNHLAGFTANNSIGLFQTTEVYGNIGIGTFDPTSLLTVYSLHNIASLTLDSIGGPNGIDTNTKFMLQLDNNVTDTELVPKSTTNVGITFSNTSFPYTAPIYTGIFNGSSYVTTPASADFNLGANDFTLEAYINITTLPTSGNYEAIYGSMDTGSNNGFRLGLHNLSGTQKVQFVGTNGGASPINIEISYTLTTGVWHHIAAVRNGSRTDLYVDGISIGNASSATIGNSAGALGIGEQLNSGVPQGALLLGSMSGARISNIARWTTNFTPPTAPYSTPVSPSAQISFQEANLQKGKIWTDGNDADKIKIDDGTTTRVTISNGNVGIGTTIPMALLDVAGTVRLQTSLMTQGASPTIGTGSTDCGTSPMVAGNDISGTVTVGTGTNGGKCTVIFSTAKSSTPNCICQNSTTANLARAANQSTTAFECTGTLTAGDKLVYWCPQ